MKYTLHPLSVEDVIEQCQTKIDRLGGHYFLTIEPNGCKSHAICMLALVFRDFSWPYSYVHINALSKEDALRWKEETSPYSSVLYIEFTSETPRLLTLVDAGDTSKGLHPVRVRGQHVAAFCSGPPQLDTLITVAQACSVGCSPIMQFLTHQLPPDPTAYVSS